MSSMKPFVFTEEAACNLINCLPGVAQWLSCIVGNVGLSLCPEIRNSQELNIFTNKTSLLDPLSTFLKLL